MCGGRCGIIAYREERHDMKNVYRDRSRLIMCRKSILEYSRLAEAKCQTFRVPGSRVFGRLILHSSRPPR